MAGCQDKHSRSVLWSCPSHSLSIVKGCLLSSGQMSTNTWLCGMGVGTERDPVWRSLQRILCGVNRFFSLRLKENLISHFWHGLGKTTRKLVSVQATTIMLPFIEDLLTTCHPFYVAYLNLSLPQPYVSGTIIISVSQMKEQRVAKVEEP